MVYIYISGEISIFAFFFFLMWWEMGGGTNSKGGGAKVGRESERKVKVKKYIGGCQFRRKKR